MCMTHSFRLSRSGCINHVYYPITKENSNIGPRTFNELTHAYIFFYMHQVKLSGESEISNVIVY